MISTHDDEHSIRGRVLALAHGAGGGTEANFAFVREALAAERDTFGRDYPGTGSRPRAAGPLRLETLADELVEHMGAHGHTRFPVLGLSLGSAVAVTAAQRHPHRVTGLILTVGFARPDAQLTLATAVWRAFAEAGREEDLARFLTYAAGAPEALARLDAAGLDALVAGTRESLPPGGADHAELAGRVALSDLDRIAVPTLVIGAAHDRMVLPGTTRALAAAIPGARYIEYDAGHIFTPEEQERWCRDIAGFLREHEL